MLLYDRDSDRVVQILGQSHRQDDALVCGFGEMRGYESPFRWVQA
jgi:hypothetical protein